MFFFTGLASKKNVFSFFFEDIGAKRRFFFEVFALFFEENRPRSGRRFFLKLFFEENRREAPFFFEVVCYFLKTIFGRFGVQNTTENTVFNAKNTFPHLILTKISACGGLLIIKNRIFDVFDRFFKLYFFEENRPRSGRFFLKLFFEENRPRSGRRFFLKLFFEDIFGREAAVFF